MDRKQFTCGQEVVEVFLQTRGEVDQGSAARGDNQDALLVVLYGAKDHLQGRLSQGYLPTQNLSISQSISLSNHIVIYLSFNLSLYLTMSSIYHSIYLFIYPYIYSSIHHLSIYSSIILN